MAEPALALTRLAGKAGCGDLLIVGPSLGTSVEAHWGVCAAHLASRFEVIGWDLPGHGHSLPGTAPFTVDELAAAVRQLTSQIMAANPTRTAWYAGVSLGGAVGFALALNPGPFRGVATLAAAPKIGETTDWRKRADLVRQAGTSVLVAAAAQRWFTPGFLDRNPATADRLLVSLADTASDSYAAACEALAGFDLRTQLVRIRVPIAVAAGECDEVITPQAAAELTAGISAGVGGTAVHVFPGCAHLPPAEDPAAVAAWLDHTFTALEASR